VKASERVTWSASSTTIDLLTVAVKCALRYNVFVAAGVIATEEEA
jgi:hypothetical protein